MTPPVRISDLTTVRSRHPEAIAEAAARRPRRPLLGPSGRLLVVAADHTARGALSAGGRRLAMADRADLLERLCVALSRPGVDGVLASSDILDDLLLLGALDGKVVMGSMNRGGLFGASFELDDRFTGPSAEDLARRGFDAGKLLLRIDPDDPGSLRTLESAARAVDGMAAHRLPVFVEPFLCRRDAGGPLHTDLTAEAVTTSLTIASGLGATSAYTWLKVPVTDDADAMADVLRATTLPVVLLGGDAGARPDDAERAYERWGAVLRLPGVRGMVAGRALLYPPDGDVAKAVDRVAELVR
ncbi:MULTISPECIES: Cgl0159 family (beta/alpha)8-fold protein [Streptomyces]|uniref:Cgl0159 family (beta/alpha)8-fold protein n=1 Tax=Streptomyces TaxID=1883 RepID=UPI00163BC9BD|nr:MULTISPECIES: deoxyribose-phosphate aldolase [Streptomyces]MBC2878406.1 deoxyribose-phosphate aldolase [Streptomyces sp. TYQ1024]UBI38744.1 deoxyribose-phosphate aldolase [Streptomyces mobaraensis]UKW31324.1 deoxyribose-phosphate aldolase [Streptomyces sp. TYQ1024]